jgi:hypothetical protein
MKFGKWAGLAVLVALLMAGPAMAQDWGGAGSVSIGGFGGYSFPVSSEAEEDVDNTDFDHQFTGGGGIMYRFPFGLAIEVDAQYLDFDYEIDDEKFGGLTQVPVMLWVSYQGKVDEGLTAHGGVGVGVNITSFDVDEEYLDQDGNPVNDVDPDTEVVLGAKAGLDYFFSPEFSIYLDGRFLYSKIDFQESFDDLEGLEGTFKAHSISVVLGLRYWFNL